ncbi:hypothetical protein [Spiroplasma phoeniceum]|uniref:OTU domain-containing protein n=1 Tax=Spiroplasma phoeniceum P40 TaxID=1276259 RepID=A0A345DSJ2_9MOLU|nr:hypothetical protein [Spiroplasma phoeniceum]AXF97183.1 hypothetical protein SDAV_002250 [Spiroplasma phoeniceum P40]
MKKIARIIGTNNDLNIEQIEQDQLITNLINKNAQKYYKLNNDIVEKSTFSKLKIKINKITWSRIIIIFFSTKDKENFIEEIKNLFITFSPSYNDNNYKLNEEELKSFAYIIWNHFSYYYDLFWNLKIDESIRIISFTNIPKGYWYESNPNLYNYIVNKNNDIVDWETFNNKKIENKQESLYYYDEFKRRKRTNNKLQNNQSYLYNVPSNGNCLFWSVVIAFLLQVRNDN